MSHRDPVGDEFFPLEVSSSIRENNRRIMTITSSSTLRVTIVARCVGPKICTASPAENGAILETGKREWLAYSNMMELHVSIRRIDTNPSKSIHGRTRQGTLAKCNAEDGIYELELLRAQDVSRAGSVPWAGNFPALRPLIHVNHGPNYCVPLASETWTGARTSKDAQSSHCLDWRWVVCLYFRILS